MGIKGRKTKRPRITSPTIAAGCILRPLTATIELGMAVSIAFLLGLIIDFIARVENIPIPITIGINRNDTVLKERPTKIKSATAAFFIISFHPWFLQIKKKYRGKKIIF
jgi:hypothetical protein